MQFQRAVKGGCGKSKWKFKMAFAIRRPTPPPLKGTNFQTFFYPTFFLLQLNPTYMKRILHFKNITFKSSSLSYIIINQPSALQWTWIKVSTQLTSFKKLKNMNNKVVKPFNCSHCDFTSSHLHNLKTHLLLIVAC